MASARPGPQSTDDGDTWTGLSSLAAQAAQVLEVSGQIASSGDASMLRESLQDGLGGLRAAIDYVIGQNGLDWDAVNRQRDRKRALYERHEDGTRTSSRSCQGSPVRSGGGGR